MALLSIIAKELKNVCENLPFNAATILSPLLFLFAFTVMVSGGITLPVETQPDQSASRFLSSVANFRAPDGTAYLELETAPSAGEPDGRSADRYVIEKEPTITKAGHEGRITHVINDVNANMTKNYANRLTGAVVNYLNEHAQAGTIQVREHTRYAVDIPWDMSFAVSTLVFGAMLAGLLFGQLSMTSEWENATTKLIALSPLPTTAIVVAKIASALAKAIVAGAVLVGVLALMFPLPLGSAYHLVLALVLTQLAFVSLGLILGIAVRSTMTAFLLSLVISLSLWVAGGGFGDLSYFGWTAQMIGAINPATYALRIVRYAYFGGLVTTQPLILLAVGSFIVAGLAVAVFSRWSHSEKVVR